MIKEFFTADNTEGKYGPEWLASMNLLVEQLIERGWDEKNAMDEATRLADNCLA